MSASGVLTRAIVVVAAIGLSSCGAGGTFSCGTSNCKTATEYCRVIPSDVASEPTTYACVPLPASCGTAASCACVVGQPCGTGCKANGDELTITCVAG